MFLSCQTGISLLNKYLSACFVPGALLVLGIQQRTKQDACPHSTNNYILDKVVRKGLSKEVTFGQ